MTHKTVLVNDTMVQFTEEFYTLVSIENDCFVYVPEGNDHIIADGLCLRRENFDPLKPAPEQILVQISIPRDS